MAGRFLGVLAQEKEQKVTEAIAAFRSNVNNTSAQLDYFRVSNDFVEQGTASGDSFNFALVKEQIEKSKSEPIKWLCGCYGFGIAANAPIHKLLLAIACLLSKQDIKFGGEETLYDMYGCKKHNLPENITSVMGSEPPIPLSTNAGEIARIYYNKKHLSGKDVDYIMQLLSELNSVRYIQLQKNGAGKQYGALQTLFMIPSLPIGANCSTVQFTIWANSMFRIEKNFLAIDCNYFKYTKKATYLQYRLDLLLRKRIRNFLLRNQKRECKFRITEVELKKIIATSPRYHYRTQRYKDDLQTAIKNCINYGLIKEVAEDYTVANEVVYTFVLCTNYPIDIEKGRRTQINKQKRPARKKNPITPQ